MRGDSNVAIFVTLRPPGTLWVTNLPRGKKRSKLSTNETQGDPETCP